MISSVEIGKMAGLLEGEASFGLYQRPSGKSGLIISLGMIDRDTVEWIAARWCSTVRLRKKEPGRQQLYVTQIQGGRAVSWLLTLYPLMGQRRRTQMRSMIAVWRTPNQSPGDLNRRKTHCPRGHCYDAQNTYVRSDGTSTRRSCRACWTIRRKENRRAA